MRLLKIRVQNFRCVEDSQEFSLSDVTCLVGKNESGKTALLKALHKLMCRRHTASLPRHAWA